MDKEKITDLIFKGLNKKEFADWFETEFKSFLDGSSSRNDIVDGIKRMFLDESLSSGKTMLLPKLRARQIARIVNEILADGRKAVARRDLILRLSSEGISQNSAAAYISNASGTVIQKTEFGFVLAEFGKKLLDDQSE